MSNKYDIALLTDSRYVNPAPTNSYIRNILYEDELLTEALESRGFSVIRMDWSNKAFEWSSVRYAIFRTTWDYFDRFDEFSQWLNKMKGNLEFINPYELIIWNLDKHYLLDLKKNEINIPETIFIEKGTNVSLSRLIADKNWDQFILKPTVSGSARHTYKISEHTIEEHEFIFSQLVSQEAMMIQPFLKSVLTEGEVTLMYFDGQYSHAIRKRAKPGDFRVQIDHGGTEHHYTPNQEEIELGLRALNVCNPKPIYARVDIITDNNGRPAISELELVEPELWFRYNPEAAYLLADTIVKQVNN